MAKIILDEVPKSIEECPFRELYPRGWKCHFIMKCVLEEGQSFDDCPACTTKKEN